MHEHGTLGFLIGSVTANTSNATPVKTAAAVTDSNFHVDSEKKDIFEGDKQNCKWLVCIT